MARISKSELIALQKKLVTDDAIGRKFNITRQAIYQSRKKYGIPSSMSGIPERNKKMVAMRKSGKSCAAVAEKFDLSIAQTDHILRKAIGKRKK